jgi:energy-coupling factor transport system permease protein
LDLGVAYALTIFFRLLGFLTASLLFVLTTDPTDLMQALMQIARLNDRFGYGTLAAYHFVPQFDTELATIRAAHRIRGVADGGGPVQAVHRYVGYMIPLLAGAVRKAERVALAMDARGFGAYPDRTYYRASRFSRADLGFGVGSALVCAGLLLGLNAIGWLGRLIPPFLG